MDKSFSFSDRHIDYMKRDARSILGWRYEPRVIFTHGKGVMITDVDGNDYYDMSAGMMSLVLGHAHPELTETIREQAGRFVHQSSWYSNPSAIEFAELIASTLPGDLNMLNYAVTGSEANEIAMRMALAVTGGFEICSVVRGLHGGSLAAEAVTTVGGARKRGLGPLTFPARSNCIIPPFYYRAPVHDEEEWDRISLQITAEMLEYATTQEIAGIIVEPMMVAGGMIVPSKRWLRGLRELADQWGALLVFDEAQLAPGRTGKMWGFQHYDVQPDIVTFGKGMSAGFAVCGAVTRPDIAERSSGKKGLPWAGTYPQDPLPCAVALKQLQIVMRDGLTEQAASNGEIMRAKLDGLRERHDCIGDVRGRGLYHVLDIVTDKESRTPDFAMAERIRYNAMLEGVVLICVKNYVRLCPPSVITVDEIDDAIGRIETAVMRAEAGYPRVSDVSYSGSLAANPVSRKSA
ncbi:MAG: aspartate aminotransferase family protein [Gammaproteobacteria bacterium]|nr:aspartate aminotransferase family protein [Gammaproteobacteria bacterium]